MDPSPSPHGAKGLAGFGGLPWDRIIEYAIESATRVVGPDDAEDVAQEVVTRLIAQERDGEAVINPQAFIRFVTHRAAIDRLRSERARSERNRRVADRAALFEPDIAEAVVAHHELVDMLDGLSPRMRDVAYLRLVDGLTQTEIAARLGISQGTVSALLARVRASLVESVRGEAE
jgi:RNA polymerase sigma factor (sigma-70 family)